VSFCRFHKAIIVSALLVSIDDERNVTAEIIRILELSYSFEEGKQRPFVIANSSTINIAVSTWECTLMIIRNILGVSIPFVWKG